MPDTPDQFHSTSLINSSAFQRFFEGSPFWLSLTILSPFCLIFIYVIYRHTKQYKNKKSDKKHMKHMETPQEEDENNQVESLNAKNKSD